MSSVIFSPHMKASSELTKILWKHNLVSYNFPKWFPNDPIGKHVIPSLILFYFYFLQKHGQGTTTLHYTNFVESLASFQQIGQRVTDM